MKTSKLTVAMNGTVVGTLYRNGKGAMSWQYAQTWLDTPGARVISQSLPLTPRRQEGEVVYNFFSNLLPDSQAIISRMQTRFKIPTDHPFDLLASVGRDCVGAIQLYPENSEIPPVTHMQATPLSDNEIAALLEGYRNAPLGMNDDQDFRISIAGAQEKTALLWHQNRWQRPNGSTPTSHIFKLPIGKIEQNNIDLSESCENEWLCLRLAREFGFSVAEATLATYADKKVLIVERFDRKWSRDGKWLMRLPQEDMCQALGYSPALKYESHGGPGIAEIMTLLLGSRRSNQDRETFFRTQIFYWLTGAIDGHAKNYSVFIEPDSAYVMTPLYDILSAYPVFGPKGISAQKAKMAMALQGKNRQYHWAQIQPRHFPATAERVGFSALRAKKMMIEMGNATNEVIERVRQSLPIDFPTHISEAIFNGMAKQAERLIRLE
ncbi:type II toxin-antitoxin system HipA family toxin [Lelliottia amnigena]|uniref:type II toxin-antitoxin system HipA family toxin n=1 Tax=Lelliottia amnigena TaxID=61646 RepID=UPI003BA32DA6